MKKIFVKLLSLSLTLVFFSSNLFFVFPETQTAKAGVLPSPSNYKHFNFEAPDNTKIIHKYGESQTVSEANALLREFDNPTYIPKEYEEIKASCGLISGYIRADYFVYETGVENIYVIIDTDRLKYISIGIKVIKDEKSSICLFSGDRISGTKKIEDLVSDEKTRNYLIFLGDKVADNTIRDLTIDSIPETSSEITINPINVSVTYDENGNYKRLNKKDLERATNGLPPGQNWECKLFYQPTNSPFPTRNEITELKINDSSDRAMLEEKSLKLKSGSYKVLCQFNISVPKDSDDESSFNWNGGRILQDLNEWSIVIKNFWPVKIIGYLQNPVAALIQDASNPNSTGYNDEQYWGKTKIEVDSTSDLSAGISFPDIRMDRYENLETFGKNRDEDICDTIDDTKINGMIGKAFCAMALFARSATDLFFDWAIKLMSDSIGIDIEEINVDTPPEGSGVNINGSGGSSSSGSGGSGGSGSSGGPSGGTGTTANFSYKVSIKTKDEVIYGNIKDTKINTLIYWGEADDEKFSTASEFATVSTESPYEFALTLSSSDSVPDSVSEFSLKATLDNKSYFVIPNIGSSKINNDDFDGPFDINIHSATNF